MSIQLEIFNGTAQYSYNNKWGLRPTEKQDIDPTWVKYVGSQTLEDNVFVYTAPVGLFGSEIVRTCIVKDADSLDLVAQIKEAGVELVEVKGDKGPIQINPILADRCTRVPVAPPRKLKDYVLPTKQKWKDETRIVFSDDTYIRLPDSTDVDATNEALKPKVPGQKATISCKKDNAL